jgi:catechol 2,3-dioxygenase-like lactoylglutathione lyase family enzyme
MQISCAAVSYTRRSRGFRPCAEEAAEMSSTAFKLEVVVLPVSDVDRAKAFYAGLGWREDADFATSDTFRVVQFTPPGSEASIIFGTGLTNGTPGAIQDLQLTVADIEAAVAELRERGVDVAGPWHDAGGVFHHGGTTDRVDGPDPERRDYCSFASFSDPDGNGWVLQEINVRLPGRVSQANYGGIEDLAEALRRAAAAHGEHEARTGQEDPDWPDWYATYMVREQTGEELPA